MERCDFSVVIRAIQNEFKAGYGKSQNVVLDEVFYSFFYQEDMEPPAYDSGLISRWFSGNRALSENIAGFYLKRENQKKLTRDIEEKVFPCLSDPAMLLEKLYSLVVGDSTISEERKAGLLQNYPSKTAGQRAKFLADVLLFSMQRPFVPRTSPKDRALPPGTQSPLVVDLIFGSQVPPPCQHFCGRRRELEQLHQLLQRDNMVSLHGIPGIGKSELAKAYVEEYSACYTNTLYLPYTGDLKRDIGDMDFADDGVRTEDEERFRRHNRFLRTLRPDTLLVIDNLNATAAEEELLPVVWKYKCRVLIITHCRFPSMSEMAVEEMEDQEDLLHLMGKLYTGWKESPALMKELIETVHGHTFAVELIARLLEHGILEAWELCERLKRERVDLKATDDISVHKDGKSQKDAYNRHIHTLFGLYTLSQEELEVLCNLSLMPAVGIYKRLFAYWLRQRDLNAINQLIEKGIIHPVDSVTISLKPILREIAHSETQPTVSRCELLLCSLQGTCLQWEADIRNHALFHQVIEGVMDGIVCDEQEEYLLFLETCCFFCHRYHYKNGMRRVAEEMEKQLEDMRENGKVHRALYLDCRATLEKEGRQAKMLVAEALELLPLETDQTAPALAQLHAHMGTLLQKERDWAGARTHMETALRLYRESGLEYDHSYVELVSQYGVLLANQGEEFRGIELLKELRERIAQSQR